MLHFDDLAHTFGAQEARYLDLGDARLKTRAAFLLDHLVAHSEAAVPEAMGTPAAAKAAYRFLENAAVTPTAIRDAHRQRTLDRIRPLPRVLFIQDTTECDYTAHPATTGLGPIGCSRHRGFFVHSTLAVTPDGQPLGLVDQQLLLRDPDTIGSTATRRARAISEKESVRWPTALTRSHAGLSTAIETITIADREADIYALFSQARGPHAHLLIRAGQLQRNVRTPEAEVRHLREAVERVAPDPILLSVAVSRRPDQAPRTAVLELRQTALALCPPHGGHGAGVGVHAILVTERVPPREGEPICWLLLTTWPVTTVDDAVQCVRWYTRRWLIERYHYIVKSGCTLEKLQVTTVEALERAQALYSIVAWRVLYLTYLGRTAPEAPCTQVFSDLEWRVLAVAACPHTPVPPTPPPMRQAVRWLAQLGGFLGRKGDGDPGPKVIWRGLRHLDDLVHGYCIAQRLLRIPG